MSEPYIAEIKLFAGDYAPRGYALCQGQLLSVQQNQPLAALIGNTYGGTLPTTIALPHFGGKTPIGQGQAPGIAAPFVVGNTGGVEAVTLSNNNLPTHDHNMGATTANGVGNVPTNTSYLAGASDAAGSPLNIYGQLGNPDTPMDVQMAPQAIGSAGGSQPLSVRNPSLTVSFIIALNGLWPSRG